MQTHKNATQWAGTALFNAPVVSNTHKPFCFLYQCTVLALLHYKSGSHTKILHNTDYLMLFSLSGVPSRCEFTTWNGTVFILKIVTLLKTQQLSVNHSYIRWNLVLFSSFFDGNFKIIFSFYPPFCKLLHNFLIIFGRQMKPHIKIKHKKICIKTNIGTSQSGVGSFLLLGSLTDLFWYYYGAGEPHDLMFCVTHFCSVQTIM
jgi:hypothetical protein